MNLRRVGIYFYNCVLQLGDESQYLAEMQNKMQETYSVDSGDLYTVFCPVIGMMFNVREEWSQQLKYFLKFNVFK